jgi:hypothetical protein
MLNLLLAIRNRHAQGRLADTNANLVGRALVVSAELAKAMGPAWDKSARDMLRTAVECLADKKKPVRPHTLAGQSEALEALSAGVHQVEGAANALDKPWVARQQDSHLLR